MCLCRVWGRSTVWQALRPDNHELATQLCRAGDSAYRGYGRPDEALTQPNPTQPREGGCFAHQAVAGSAGPARRFLAITCTTLFAAPHLFANGSAVAHWPFRDSCPLPFISCHLPISIKICKCSAHCNPCVVEMLRLSGEGVPCMVPCSTEGSEEFEILLLLMCKYTC